MEVAGAAASGADCQLTADLGFSPCGEGGYLFVPNHLPIDAFVGAYGVGEAVKGVPGDAVDALDAGFDEGFYEDVGDFGKGIFLEHRGLLPYLAVTTYRLGCRDSR
jgi:hypothetical protein